MKPILFTFCFIALVSPCYAGPFGSGKDAKAPVIAPPEAPPPPSCNISYDYFEGGWTHVMPDAGSAGDGYFVSMNKSINDRFFALLHGGQTFFSNSDFLDVAGGVGFHAPIGDCFDWVVKTAAFYEDSSLFGSNTGWNVGTGFRVSLAKWLELNTFYHASDYWSGDGIDHAGTASVILKEILLPRFDTVLSGVYTDAGTAVSVGMRYNF